MNASSCRVIVFLADNVENGLESLEDARRFVASLGSLPRGQQAILEAATTTEVILRETARSARRVLSATVALQGRAVPAWRCN